MDRELAESYVQYQTDKSRSDKKTVAGVGIGLAVVLGLCSLMYNGLAFKIIVFCIAIFDLVSIITYWFLPKIQVMFTVYALLSLYLLIMSNSMYFACYRLAGKHIGYEWGIFILIQLLSYGVTIPLTKYFANKHDKNKKALSGAILASFDTGLGAFIYGTVALWFRFANPPLEKVLIILFVLVIMLSWDTSYKVSRSVYCNILIKRYKLNIYNKYNPKPEQVENTAEETPSDNCGNPSD